MKSIHFCTPQKLAEIKKEPIFETIRTGWIPQLFPGDEVKINERTNKDQLLFFATIISVTPILYRNLGADHQEEIERYGKKFHPEQYFFIIKLKKKTTQKTLF